MGASLGRSRGAARTTTGLQASTLPRLYPQGPKPPSSCSLGCIWFGVYGSALRPISAVHLEAARRDHAALIQGEGGLCPAVAREAGLAPWLQCEGAVVVETEHHLGGAGV